MSAAIASKTPRQQRTEQVKRSIVQATMSIIREYGVEQATISNICKTAGVSNGSFYHHFGSKDEVLSQYLTEAFDRRSDEFDQITGDDVVENVIRYYALYNAFLLDLGFDFVKNFYTNTNKALYSHRNHLLGQTRSMPLMQTIDRILSQAQDDGYLAQDCDIAQLTYDMSVLEKGVLFDWCLSDGEYDLIEQMTRMLRNHLMSTAVSEKYLKEHGPA